MQNGTATLGASLAVSYNVTHGLILQSSNEALRYLSKYIENLCHTKICTQIFIAVSFVTAQIGSNQDVFQKMSG